MFSRQSFLAGLVFFLLGACPLWAQNSRDMGAVGVWKSNSGNTFKIPYSTRSFDIIITYANGQRAIGQGSWVEFNRRFTYTVSGIPGSALATFDRHDPNKLKVDMNGQRHYWTRISY